MIVSPSILSADFGRLDQDIEMLNRSDAQLIHCDVMDGVFVPNISFGFPVIEAVARKATKELDVHLMIVNPQNYISQVHQEACVHLHRTVQAIKDAGMKAAVTLNPATPVETLTDIITELDMVLLMSVNPGFGGQKFIANTVAKTRRLRSLIDRSGSKALIQIDGGINHETGRLVAQAGADSVVAGSAVFKAENPELYISELAKL